MSSCWCVRQVTPAGLLLGLPGLSGWLVRDMREELQEGHLDPSSPLLPASASALPFRFPFWLPVSPAPQCGNWIYQLPGPGLPFPHMDTGPALRAHRATLCLCDLLLLFPRSSSGHVTMGSLLGSHGTIPMHVYLDCSPPIISSLA